jgi:cell wall assembly regulator SMI1
LSEAQRVHRNEKIAEKAHTGTVNVKKCRFILESANKELVDALRRGEISINRAHAWLKSKSKDPAQELAILRLEKESGNSIETAVSKLAATHSGCDQDQETTIALPEFISALTGLESAKLQQIEMRVIQSDSQVILISRQLLKLVKNSRAQKGGFSGGNASEQVA